MADDNETMRVELDLPRWVVEALARWKAPADHVGVSIEQRIAFLADDLALSIVEEERREAEGGTPAKPEPRLSPRLLQ